MSFDMSFNEVEALLAQTHGVASEKRIAFQGRLKTILRLGLPSGIMQGRGRAARYSAGDLAMMALYVDLSQLGLNPERSVAAFGADEFMVYAAIKRSVDLIASGEWGRFRAKQETDAEPILLYLDPATWSPLTIQGERPVAFQQARASAVARGLTRATSNRDHLRLAILNVTALLDDLATWMPRARRAEFLADLERWAHIGTQGFPERPLISDWEKA